MPIHVVILGAGFAGLELSTRLAEEGNGAFEVTLVDQGEGFTFGFAKLDVLIGERTVDEVRTSYDALSKPGVTFRRERILSVDPEARRVVTDTGVLEADVLVVALGADLDPGATPGLVEDGYEFYSPEGAGRLHGALESFDGGRIVVAVLGPFFKCPPAPYEGVFLLHEFLTRRGVRAATSLHLLTTLSSPIPVSPDASALIETMLAERGIEHWTQAPVTHLDPSTKTAHVADGRSVPYDLFIGIPVHKAPDVVVASGLAVDGWIPVDAATFATRFADVYAVGDVTSAPVPRAGSIAEGEAGTVADVLLARFAGGPEAPPYPGVAVCYIEMGDDVVGRVDADFLSGPSPVARFSAPSLEIAGQKREFGSSRLARWFGR
jgi:sulfide:quinone oxidoreductase